MKKRILQLTGSFHQGGSERQAVSLASMLRHDGEFEVHLAALSSEGPLGDDAVAAGFADIAEFPLTSFYDIGFLRQVKNCAKYLRENKIDLIHTHDFYTNVFGITAATYAGLNARVASKRETDGMRSTAQDFIEGIAFGRAPAIVANSTAVKEYLMGRGIAVAKISVIYNGLDVEKFENAAADGIREPYGLPSNVSIVTLVANLRHDVKNIPMLMRAAKLLGDTKAHFVIAGEGELMNHLKAQAVDLGITERIHFIGRCTDVPSLLAASDICVLTSKAEGFSNSILEYMAAGKPVVATNVGGAAEVITDGSTGYIVESDDDATLAERLSQLIENKALAMRFGAEGKRVVGERFSLTRQLNETKDLYNSLLR